MKEQEVVKNVDFKEIKTRFSYLNLKRDSRTHSRTEKLRDITQKKLEEANANANANANAKTKSQKSDYEYFEYGIDTSIQASLKKTQELVERIKDTSLYVRFQKTEGAMRAHVMNKVTNELVAIIPWQNMGENRQVQQNNQFLRVTSNIFAVFGSSLIGGEVDKQI